MPVNEAKMNAVLSSANAEFMPNHQPSWFMHWYSTNTDKELDTTLKTITVSQSKGSTTDGCCVPATFNLFVITFPILVIIMRVPGQPLLIERDDHLRTAHICQTSWYQVRFIGVFPTIPQNSTNELIQC